MKLSSIALSVFALTFCSVSCQTWVSRGRFPDANEFFRKVMQEVISELERREWCNLTVNDIVVPINDHMYNWHVAGNVTYTNGFVVSIQKIDLSNIESMISSRTVNSTVQAVATVRGMINLRDVNMGFDVVFDLVDGSTQRFTGMFLYNLMQFQIAIAKNFHTKELTVTTILASKRGSSPRMIYMPANHTTEVLSRQFRATTLPMASVGLWGSVIMRSIILDLVPDRIEFPSVCFVNC